MFRVGEGVKLSKLMKKGFFKYKQGVCGGGGGGGKLLGLRVFYILASSNRHSAFLTDSNYLLGADHLTLEGGGGGGGGG